MVPVIELDMRNPARAEPTTPFTGFPPWTRGDDDEYEDGERHQAKRRLERLKARSWRGRNGKPSALATRALPAAAEHSNHRRGILKDAIDAVDKIVFGDSSEEAATSDESGYDSDSSTAPNGPLRDTDYPLTLSPPPLVTLAPAPQPITPTLTASPEVVLPTEESLPPPIGNATPKPPRFTSASYTTPILVISTATTAPRATPTSTSTLTAIITGPIPFLSSDARKGVEGPMTGSPSPTTPTKSLPATATSPSALATAEPEKIVEDERYRQGDLYAKTEKALVAVGSVGAIIIVFFVFWLGWKCFKLRRRRELGRNWKVQRQTLEAPKHAIVNLASRVPILRARLDKRRWSNLEKPYDRAYWAGSPPASSGETRNDGNRITVHTAITRSTESSLSNGSNKEGSGPSRHVPNYSISSTGPQFNDTLRSNYHIPNVRMSDISSLSSGFGDGDIIMPPPNNVTSIATTQIETPMPAMTRTSVSGSSNRRETMCTEASEDAVPRFRNINSWVRQQTGRVKRAKQWDMNSSNVPPVPSMPPEQDFKLMMPDGEEPRRVETTTLNNKIPGDVDNV